jgi:peroxiredoxin (alkyl hydroperoxide reductase subunit C)
VIVPPPKTLAEMDARIADTTCEKIDFYLAKKTI